LAALASIATVAAVILTVRFYGAELDGSLRESAPPLIPKPRYSSSPLLGALMEMRRRGLAEIYSGDVEDLTRNTRGAAAPVRPDRTRSLSEVRNDARALKTRHPILVRDSASPFWTLR